MHRILNKTWISEFGEYGNGLAREADGGILAPGVSLLRSPRALLIKLTLRGKMFPIWCN